MIDYRIPSETSAPVRALEAAMNFELKICAPRERKPEYVRHRLRSPDRLPGSV